MRTLLLSVIVAFGGVCAAAPVTSAAWPRGAVTSAWDEGVRALQTIDGDLLFFAIDLRGKMASLKAALDRASALESPNGDDLTSIISRLYDKWPQIKALCPECTAFEETGGHDPALGFFRALRSLRRQLASLRGLPVSPSVATACRQLPSHERLLRELSEEALRETVEAFGRLRVCLDQVVEERFTVGIAPRPGQSRLFEGE